MVGARARTAFVVAVAQLRQHRIRTLLAVLGIALGVLLMVLLAGLGHGLLTAGGDAMTYIQADLWMTGGPATIAPGAIGGIENPIQNAHGVADRIERHEGVNSAQPLAFQTVYVSPESSGFDTVVGVGGLGDGEQLGLNDDPRFTPGDVHYANGSYDGPMTHEVVVGPELAKRYDVGVGDTLYIGGTLIAAQQNEFKIVAVRTTFSRFLGTPTVAVHLSELQEVSGTTGTDGAAIVGIQTASGADVRAVEGRLERSFPENEVRTNDEQVRAIIGGQAAIVASAVTLVAVSVVVGIVLVVNVLATMVFQQRRELAALKAAGVRSRTLVYVVIWQGILIGTVGGLVAVAATPFAADGLDEVTKAVASYPLVSDPPWLLAVGFALAVGIGTIGAAVAGWRVVRLSPLEHLE